MSRRSVTLAWSLPCLTSSLSLRDLSVWLWPMARDIARSIEDFPAPFGPRITFSPGASLILLYSWLMKSSRITSLMKGLG